MKTEAEQYLGMSMTYSLFEFVKEKFDELIKEQPEHEETPDVDKLCISDPNNPQVIITINYNMIWHFVCRRQ